MKSITISAVGTRNVQQTISDPKGLRLKLIRDRELAMQKAFPGSRVSIK